MRPELHTEYGKKTTGKRSDVEFARLWWPQRQFSFRTLRAIIGQVQV